MRTHRANYQGRPCRILLRLADGSLAIEFLDERGIRNVPENEVNYEGAKS